MVRVRKQSVHRPAELAGTEDPVPGSIAITELPETCPRCRQALRDHPQARALKVCPECELHLPMSGPERIAWLVDSGSFEERDRQLTSTDPLTFRMGTPYQERLQSEQARTNQRDSIVTGTARLDGQQIMICVVDGFFMHGTIGVVAGERLARAAEMAVKREIPLVTTTSCSGLRLEEGMLALQQTSKLAAAIKAIRLKGIPYVSVLTGPSSADTLALFPSYGDVVMAEPGAIVDDPTSEDVRRQEDDVVADRQMLDSGRLDGIVHRRDLHARISTILRLWKQSIESSQSREETQPFDWRADPLALDLTSWQTLLAARSSDRPTARSYITMIADEWIELRGDRSQHDDPAITTVLGFVQGVPVAFVGEERSHQSASGQYTLAALQKISRVVALSARWQIPIVTLLDRPALSAATTQPMSTTGSVSAAIAHNISLLADLPVPTIAIVIGEANGVDALALATCDRIYMQEHTVLSVIRPEMASRYFFNDELHAPQLADSLHITAADHAGYDMIDGIIREPAGGSSTSPDQAAVYLRHAILMTLDELRKYDANIILRQRSQRFRSVGSSAVQSASAPIRALRWVRDRVGGSGLVGRPRRRILQLPSRAASTDDSS